MIDEYLDKENSYNRLKREFEKHKRLIIAYELDSTVYDYHHTNASYEMVKDLIRKYEKYAYFIVFTSSTPDRYDEIKSILNKEKNYHIIQLMKMLHLYHLLVEKYITIYYLMIEQV
ncbi:MAG: hypothetical protein L6V81_08955 [Clostridium sp.]|nr:MAG: hypothetical protein L6V81_08955 [Clostridium sp.]